jgi:NADH-quinone oxidoreductase subunit L
MFRLHFLTFNGTPRFDESKTHPHESPIVMTTPLVILAILSAIGGFIGIPEIFSGEHGNAFHNWMAPIFKSAELKLDYYGTHTHFEELLLMIISVAGALAGIFAARHIYLKNPEIAGNFVSRFKTIYKLLFNKYYVDEAYDATIVNPTINTSRSILWKIVDNKIIDGLVNSLAVSIGDISSLIRKLQSGFVQSYAVVMMIGILLAFFWLILSL